MNKAYYFLRVLIGLLAAYFIWASADRITSARDLFPRYVIGEVKEIGTNTGKGNIIALSPYFHTTDFSSKEAYFKMFQFYLDFVKRKKLINDSTIIVLPEYTGTWLVVANEKRSVFSDTTVENGLKTVVYSNILKFGWSYVFSSAPDKMTESVFKMKSSDMLDIYQSTFSTLAKKFKVTIIAGSIILPGPVVTNGKIEINKSKKLYNISAVFDIDGNVVVPLTYKHFPIKEEQGFTASAVVNEIPVYKLQDRNFSILICADTWYPEFFQQFKDKKVDMVLVPSFVAGKNTWNKKWQGYNGAASPNDVDTSDIGKIYENEAWIKYGMAGRLMQSEINTGVNVFLNGDLWNLGTNGQTIVVTTKFKTPYKIPSIFEGNDSGDKSGSLINVWLE